MLRQIENPPGEIRVMNGNLAAAWGARLCRPEVIAAYPITPQTPLIEYLARFIGEGELDADLVEVEGELSGMSVLQGASLAGSRTFTGTSAQGLAFMYEAYFRSSTLRLPLVMAVATREMNSPQTVWSGQQDILTVRDAGWILLLAEDNQEIMDTVIMAYRIAEDPKVLLPVNVCYDGFYLSHLTEGVRVPPPELVDRFLHPYAVPPGLVPGRPRAFDPVTLGDRLVEFRYKHCAAMEKARELIPRTAREFGESFGRFYGGLIEEFEMEGAEVALITLGSVTGTAREVVEELRAAGRKVGLIKIRAFRPFPGQILKRALAGCRAAGVIDRSVSFGWGGGIAFVEVKAALGGAGLPLIDFIGGLGGADIRIEHLHEAFALLEKAAAGQEVPEVTWLGLEFED